MSAGIPEGFTPLLLDSAFQNGFGQLYYKPKAGGALIGWQVEAHHLNRYGIVHGGAIAAFMDSALGNAVLQQPQQPLADVTVSLSIDYMAAGPAAAWIEADVVVPKMGKRLAFAHCEVRALGRVIASGRGVFSLQMPHPAQPAGTT